MTLVDRLFRQDDWRTVPNAITLVRLLLLPVFIVLIVDRHYWSSMVVIAVVFLTDFVDGFVARKTNSISELGKWLDPVADRLTVIAVVAAFALGGLLPWPVFVLILLPDVLLSIVSLVAFGGASFPVTWVGKVRTAFIFTGLLLLLVGVALVDQGRVDGAAGLESVGQTVETVASVLLVIGLIGHYVAAVIYGVALGRRMRDR
ncbi:CDP-alcohol phosphatidyltransferase family protein [Frigoribacterium sp. CFBP9039]|uniref:CDP-alcohol phosphatidyltransferase family protein n=1 Tax=unclassified Frigoribacterium TaxID=2627005 RepID=UPI00177BDC08|nr:MULTISPECIES: CDP-alcohol phosphatidyltransferase family protein [unclassified Frigoribacterium]MBD8703929.1 CDP-alcohol phosphatidyltransferase family protein [Frigoribacterium sp. CFBP 13712]MDY0892195.1 CDP-alcohol phosphatidyltransferase family protein [Frigoribacterium sp. CFBP9030]MDY0947283.1 CDP-alcohol phosphatidyltransferase family protein [Frigoribacterium sp. CFBP9039]